MTKKIIQVNKNPVYEIGMIGTVFGKDTVFNGDLNFKKSLQINGKFEGEINSSGFLVIGEDAVIKANIRAKTVIVKGTIHGNVEAVDKLEIQSKGKIFGNIRTGKLTIADGVQFEGSCEMIKPSEKTKSRDSSKAESA